MEQQFEHDAIKLIEADWLDTLVFVVEGIRFELLELTTEQVELIKSLEGYEEILSEAASMGWASGRKRVAEITKAKPHLDSFWDKKELEVDTDPCIKYRVGEKVCEISGLTEFLADKLAEYEEEKAAIHIDGDNEEPSFDVTMGDLAADAALPANNM